MDSMTILELCDRLQELLMENGMEDQLRFTVGERPDPRHRPWRRWLTHRSDEALTMTEEWRDIQGYEGRYQVSSEGRVWSLLRDKPLKQSYNQAGYPSIALYPPGKTFLIHRLVAEAFIPNPDGHPWVLHWNDTKTDNRAENLRWGTPSDNENDKVRNGNNANLNKTHCKRGHSFTGDNVAYDLKGRRLCKECCLIRNRSRARPRLEEGDPRHGTYHGYNRHRCRCDKCRVANTLQKRKEKEARKLRDGEH